MSGHHHAALNPSSTRLSQPGALHAIHSELGAVVVLAASLADGIGAKVRGSWALVPRMDWALVPRMDSVSA